ncbi:MAG TPA: hypothetical protein VFG31_03570 [Conexibacter sp.]|nr:hypothetical protein [Conexibacter sp.]
MTNSSFRPRPGLLALATASGLAAALLAPVVHAAPSAHQAARSVRYTRCDVSGVAHRLGPTSVTSLKVAGGVTCGRGVSLVRAFHQCRLANGPSGRCVRLVRGYACREQRTTVGTQISATVTCAKRSKSVVHSYTQTTA